MHIHALGASLSMLLTLAVINLKSFHTNPRKNITLPTQGNLPIPAEHVANVSAHKHLGSPP